LEQEIIELVRLSTAEDVRDIGFSSPCISIGTRSLIKIKCVSKLAKYISQLFISNRISESISQLELLFAEMILGPEIGKTVWPG